MRLHTDNIAAALFQATSHRQRKLGRSTIALRPQTHRETTQVVLSATEMPNYPGEIVATLSI